MFNLLLALITGLVMGWNFHSFFIQLNPPIILKNDINVSKTSKKESISPIIQKIKEIPKVIAPPKVISKEQNSSKKTVEISENFYTLLEKDLFSDAMSYYIDAKDVKLSLYREKLLTYFEEKIKTNPQIAMEQMLELQELEPKETKVNEEKLHQIEYENNPTEQANILLELIKQVSKKEPEYQEEIALHKIGEHFTLDVQVNNESLTLLLDTGATLTMVNENKLPLLTLLKNNITLNTAGGKINAQLQEADSFSVGNIKLEKFQIVSSSFEQKDADGLLGMNFFKKFKFKIDQENSLLYLSRLEKE